MESRVQTNNGVHDMKSVVVVSAVTILAAAAGSFALHAGTPAPSNYAEGVYADFAKASSSRVSFEVRTIASGPMRQLEGRSIAQVIGEPRYQLGFEETRDSRVVGAAFAPTAARIDRTALDGGVEGFDVVGLPVGQGHYRNLSVRASASGQVRTHQAIEFCWDAQDHCVVYDPQIEFLDSVVNNYRLAKAEGDGTRIEEIPAPVATGIGGRPDVTIQASCRLASNHGIIGLKVTSPSRTVTYKNIYGMTLVKKTLGAQQRGITCTSSCNPAMYGYSNASSGYGSLGYEVDCGYKHTTGTTGRKGTSVSEAKCAHTFTGTAKADVSIKGKGAAVDLAWSTNGGVDGSGGALTDTCGFF